LWGFGDYVAPKRITLRDDVSLVAILLWLAGLLQNLLHASTFEPQEISTASSTSHRGELRAEALRTTPPIGTVESRVLWN